MFTMLDSRYLSLINMLSLVYNKDWPYVCVIKRPKITNIYFYFPILIFYLILTILVILFAFAHQILVFLVPSIPFLLYLYCHLFSFP